MQEMHKSIFPAPVGFFVRINGKITLLVRLQRSANINALYKTWCPVGQIRVHLFIAFSNAFFFSFSSINCLHNICPILTASHHSIASLHHSLSLSPSLLYLRPQFR